MLESGEKEIKPALFKLEEYKEYRKVVGQNQMRNKALVEQSSMRSDIYELSSPTKNSPFKSSAAAAFLESV